MPVALEQWRAAVGDWNRRLAAGMPSFNTEYFHFAWCRSSTQSERHRHRPSKSTIHPNCEITTSCGQITHGMVCCALTGARTKLIGYTVALVSSFISVVARILLIMSGDVELNPGPSKPMIIHCLVGSSYEQRGRISEMTIATKDGLSL